MVITLLGSVCRCLSSARFLSLVEIIISNVGSTEGEGELTCFFLLGMGQSVLTENRALREVWLSTFQLMCSWSQQCVVTAFNKIPFMSDPALA